MEEITKIIGRSEAIIWDFNGTLLDDAEVCIGCMNQLLAERSLPLLDQDRYKDIFTFPVRDYYEVLGFDFDREPFDVPAHQFIDLYRARLSSAPLHKGIGDILEFIQTLGIRQVVLSAMEQDFLDQTIRSKGIEPYFEKVLGINNHLGDGKLELAAVMLARLNVPPDRLCLIGDTVHDYEVALETGIPCILVADGHQSFSRLKKLDCPVLESLSGLREAMESAWSG